MYYETLQTILLTLHKPATDKAVHWGEDVIDNEHMGKKTSKCKPHVIIITTPSISSIPQVVVYIISLVILVSRAHLMKVMIMMTSVVATNTVLQGRK